MTVKSLTDIEKAQIDDLYTQGVYTIPELALIYNRSRRTVIRALEEQGAYTIKKRAPKPKPVPVVIPTKTPWWKRVIDGFRFTYLGRGEGPTA
jgi:hypothetical protein